MQSKQSRRWLTFIETSSPREPVPLSLPTPSLCVCTDRARVLAIAFNNEAYGRPLLWLGQGENRRERGEGEEEEGCFHWLSLILSSSRRWRRRCQTVRWTLPTGRQTGTGNEAPHCIGLGGGGDSVVRVIIHWSDR